MDKSPEGHNTNPKDNQKNISRKNFLGLAATTLGATGLVAAGIGAAKKEIQIGKDGIETENGIFIPLYEKHTDIHSPEDIPESADFYFQEFSMTKDDFLLSASDFIHRQYRLWNKNYFFLEPVVLQKMAKNQTSIVFGETECPYPELYNLDIMARIMLKTAIGGSLEVLSPYLAMKSRQSNSYMSRRQFLKKSALAFGTGLMFISSAALEVLPTFMNKKDTIQRLITRLNGIQSNFQIEQAIVFFKNLIIAEKMLALAESIKPQFGRKPKIVFNLGASHSGIEDMLRLDRMLLLEIINKYPLTKNKDLLDLVGGAENLAKIIIIRLPQDFTADKFDDPDMMRKVIREDILDKELYDVVSSSP